MATSSAAPEGDALAQTPPTGAPRRGEPREPISIVCVFNKPEVLHHCLTRSVEADRHRAPETELIPVDNSDGRFASAGAALNHGARLARHDYVAFVHQDVYLHSLPTLEKAAGVLAKGAFGLLGAIGVRADGSLAGRIRDRVVLSGDPAPEPQDVDSVDEVLFMVPRALVVDDPLSEARELSWHAYAVEYGLRLRTRGLRVGAVNIPLTHNSLTVNLDKLDVAHAAVGAGYPALLPIRTTCGTIGATSRQRGRLEARAVSEYRWLRESLAVRPASSSAPSIPVVLSDIRIEIDDILSRLDSPLTIVNIAGANDPLASEHMVELALDRIDRTISFEPARRDGFGSQVRSIAHSALFTNLDPAMVRLLVTTLDGHPMRLGYQEDAGTWLAVGAAAQVELPAWRSRHGRPIGAPRR